MNGISTAKTKFSYCVESIAGTRPTSGYILIHNCRSIPDFNTEPAQLDTTSLDNEEWMSNTAGLKDLGGAKAFNFLNNSELRQEWNDFYTAYETGKASDLETWICIQTPDGAAFYFTGEPAKLGYGGAEVNSVQEVAGYISVSKVHGYDDVPAIMTASPNVINAVVGTNATSTLANRVGTASVTSSNSGVATASAAGNTVTIVPVAAGNCVVTVVDGTTGESIPIFVTVSAT